MARPMTIIRCTRCDRRLLNRDTASTDGWKVILKVGIVTSVMCPDCVTPEEHLESEVNDTLTEVLGTHRGRIYGRPKTDGDPRRDE